MASTDPERLLNRLRGVKVVLFDFDGPLCDLFAGYSAESVAGHMKEFLADKGWLLPQFEGYTDTHQLLQDVAFAGFPEEIVKGLDGVLVDAERQAAMVAHPVDGVAELIQGLAAQERPMAITTNNSPASVQVYLKKYGLEQEFGGRIFGRGDAPDRMKPHPAYLRAAMEELGWVSTPGNCLMIGDSVRDLWAARAAHVKFLAYAGIGDRYQQRVDALLGEGVDLLVRDMRELVEAFSAAGLGRRGAPVGE
ncbi:HAD family hydrolase [Streptomyces sp. NPDC088354]|uniref:HAD family hydrolase n=1 Tax=unclassified Streptomyces TaxID=2593676 RepID=UPI0029BDAB5A|nr:HAD-IA family hydrolase [Streptomyces sp. MI02-7b]MDX3076502.1 HAD-IA family hydrolase [Streptomyces sp. MI02-7b]